MRQHEPYPNGELVPGVSIVGHFIPAFHPYGYPLLSETQYIVRFACCGHESTLTHTYVGQWKRGKANRKTNLCQRCAMRASKEKSRARD